MELLRQPIYLILMSFSAAFIVFLASIYYFALGNDPKLVKDSTLAVMLLIGLFGAVTSAAASVSHEIRAGTALAVLAKPVNRAQFLLAKFCGVAAALAILAFVDLLASLLASRMAFDVYGHPDYQALAIFFSSLVVAYLLGGFTNYFLGRPFVSDAVLFHVAMITAAFFVIVVFTEPPRAPYRGDVSVDWRLVPAGILILLALWLLAGIAVLSSTRWELIPTLAICSGFFLLGLMSDYLFGRLAGEAWWASVLYTILPNWQLFWMADALQGDKTIPWSYVFKAIGYFVTYLGALLALALTLFEDRELT